MIMCQIIMIFSNYVKKIGIDVDTLSLVINDIIKKEYDISCSQQEIINLLL